MITETLPEAAASSGPAAAGQGAPLPPGAPTGARTVVGNGAGPRLQPRELAALAALATGATARRASRLIGVSDRTYRRRLTAAVTALDASGGPVHAMFLATLRGEREDQERQQAEAEQRKREQARARRGRARKAKAGTA